MKINWKYFILFLIAFVVFIVYQANKPKKINWTESYSSKDKIPFGAYICYELLPELFAPEDIRKSTKTIYETLNEQASLLRYNYIIINNEFSPEQTDAEELVKFVENGNHVFIAANKIEGLIADTINLYITDTLTFSENDHSIVRFVNQNIDKRAFEYFSGNLKTHIASFDSANTTILAENETGKTTMIKTQMGKGFFIISSTPEAFTNYNILYKNTDDFVSTSFSYLPVATVIWDEYYKVGRRIVRTPLRFILSQEALKFAYFIALLGLVIFILFESKRRQRVIPVIEPLQNTSLEFINTLGRLYYSNKDHKNISEKIITYFMDSLKSRYYLRVDYHDKQFAETVSEKSGVALSKVQELIRTINDVKSKSAIRDEELKNLNNKINEFNRVAK